MDDAVNRHVRELIDAINVAVSHDPAVEACRQRAREAGYELQVTLEAVVKVAGRRQAAGKIRPVVPPSRTFPDAHVYTMTEADRRFLRSLRIAANQTADEEV